MTQKFSIKFITDEIKVWNKCNFPDAQPWEPLVGMQEELGELSHAFLKQHQGIRQNEDHYGDMVDAVGDVFIYMANFCWQNNIDMEEAILATWRKVRQRDWTKHNETNSKAEKLNGCCKAI
jgi:NTP pyrophosphatase (non-canonical NTP hydrolase)|tara:strand:+ start:16590 stop:16952 length:363 start_codon:yes stop_codon:yes gene_type:complete